MGVQVRQFKWDDVEKLVPMCNASLVADGESAYVDTDYFKMRYGVPAHFPENSYIAWQEDEPIGANMTLYSRAVGKGLATLYLHPDERNGEMPRQLIEASDEHLRDFGNEHTEDAKPVYLLRGVEAHLKDLQDLLVDIGYEDVRHFYGMKMELPSTVDAPLLPAGLRVVPFNPQIHAEAMHRVYDQSFRDSWGMRDGVAFEPWKRGFMTDEMDYSLWVGVWDGEHMIGFSVCLVDPTGIEQGKVRALGVLSDYRGQGIGTFLLQYSFHKFIKHGLKRAALNVDVAADTNPLSIYKKAGMQVDTHSIIMRRILRGNAEDIND